ncbi:MAG: outer membrane beta-barrel protein [Planctomycetaceae bacterium]|nr:outer membrane beta-barrel protein [Planctomycetaceae bacterium]
MRKPYGRAMLRGTMAALLICASAAQARAQAASDAAAPAPEAAATRAAEPSRWSRFLGRFGINRSTQSADAPLASNSSARNVDSGVRAVTAGPSELAAQPSANQPPAPDAQPPAAQPPETPPSPSEIQPGQPGSRESNLNVPAAERGLGGGEPTESTVAAEEKEAEKAAEAGKVDARGLLMKALNVPEDEGWRIFGWIENSFTGNANGRGNGVNFGVTPNFKTNQWMGNQYYLVFEKPLKQEDWVNFGFRMDNLFGNDWQFNYMQGLFNRAFPPGWFPGYDIAQLFGEVHLPILTRGGLDVRGGRWYTLAGYEVVPATGRPLLSVPYMFNYGQPFTHIGVLTTLHVTDKLNLYSGAINGFDRFINEKYIWGYIGGFAWTSKDEKTALAFTCVWGPNQFPRFLPANQPIYPTGYINIPSVAGLNNPGYKRNDRTLFTTVLTHKWNDKLTQVMETDQGMERSIPGLGAPVVNNIPQNAAPNYDTWYSFGNWFLYNFNDKIMGVWRSEVFWDTHGARTLHIADGRFVGDRFYEQTLGAQIKPYSWLWIRPEARYDWSQYHPAYSVDPATGLPTRKSQLTLAFDVILLF